MTAISAKRFERASLLPKITTHTYRVVDKLHFAYQANWSTDDAIITLIHQIAQHLDGDSQYARSLFIDYSSTLTTMQPRILISRLLNTTSLQHYNCKSLTSSQIDSSPKCLHYYKLLLHYYKCRSPTRTRLVTIFVHYIYMY